MTPYVSSLEITPIIPRLIRVAIFSTDVRRPTGREVNPDIPDFCGPARPLVQYAPYSSGCTWVTNQDFPQSGRCLKSIYLFAHVTTASFLAQMNLSPKTNHDPSPASSRLLNKAIPRLAPSFTLGEMLDGHSQQADQRSTRTRRSRYQRYLRRLPKSQHQRSRREMIPSRSPEQSPESNRCQLRCCEPIFQ